jgi:predicted metalloprotease with PDZ domain
MIRDASDNAESLDGVMRSLYAADYQNGRGFTPDEWWGAVSRAAKGAKFTEFNEKYIDGREPFAWNQWLPKAGWRFHADTLHEPRLGVRFQADSTGLVVVIVEPGGTAATAGIRPGDVVTSIAGVPVSNPAWESWRQKYANQEGAPIAIGILRGGVAITVNPAVKFATIVERKLEADPDASDKAKRIRDGILKGTTANR